MKAKNLTLTELQEWFIRVAIEAKDAVLPFNALDDDTFVEDYGFSKLEIKRQIDNLLKKLNARKLIN